MISKLVISFTIISVVGHCMGENDIEANNRDIMQQHKNYQKYDLFSFPEIKAQHFGIYNRQCLLACMMFITKGLFASTHENTVKTNLKMAMDIILRIFRSSAGQPFFSYLNVKTNLVPILDKMRYWLVSFDTQAIREMQTLTFNLFKNGFEYGVWYTEKELELLDAYRRGDNQLIHNAMLQCSSTMKYLATPSLRVEEDYPENLYMIDHNIPEQFDGKKQAMNQGIIVLLMTPDEYQNIFLAESSNEDKYYEVLNIAQSAVENIFDGILNLLYSRNIFACDFLGTVELPSRPMIQLELLILLQHLFPRVVDIVREIFLLQLVKSGEGANFQSYISFSKKFRAKWSWLLDEGVENNVSQSNDGQTLASDTTETISNNKHIITDPGNNHPLQNNGRLIKTGVVFPSIMPFYSVFNKSWNDGTQNETNMNHNKIFLYEINGWIQLMKHSLQFMPPEVKEKRGELQLDDSLKQNIIWQQLNIDSTFMDKYNPSFST